MALFELPDGSWITLADIRAINIYPDRQETRVCIIYTNDICTSLSFNEIEDAKFFARNLAKHINGVADDAPEAFLLRLARMDARDSEAGMKK